MTLKSVSMAAPFQWFAQSVASVRRNPRPLLGATAAMTAIVLLISAAQVTLQALLPPTPAVTLAIYAGVTLVGWIALPPLFGGAYRVIDAAERGQPVTAGELLAGWSQPGFATRLILTALAFSLIYLAAIGLTAATPVGQFYWEYFQLTAMVPPGTDPDMAAVLALIGRAPAGTAPITMLLMLALTLWSNAYMFAMAHAALAGDDVGQSVRGGFAAMLRNILPLLGFTVAAAFAGFLVMLMFVLVLALVAGVLSLLSPALAMVVLVPAVLALLVVMYALMFGFYYHGWREMRGDAQSAAPGPADTIAL